MQNYFIKKRDKKYYFKDILIYPKDFEKHFIPLK